MNLLFFFTDIPLCAESNNSKLLLIAVPCSAAILIVVVILAFIAHKSQQRCGECFSRQRAASLCAALLLCIRLHYECAVLLTLIRAAGCCRMNGLQEPICFVCFFTGKKADAEQSDSIYEPMYPSLRRPGAHAVVEQPQRTQQQQSRTTQLQLATEYKPSRQMERASKQEKLKSSHSP